MVHREPADLRQLEQAEHGCGVPKRAASVEAALVGAEWTKEGIAPALAAYSKDFTPLSDMRASADYRMQTARNMLERYLLEDQGVAGLPCDCSGHGIVIAKMGV